MGDKKDIVKYLRRATKEGAAVSVRPSVLAEELDVTVYQIRSVLKALVEDEGWLVQKEDDPFVYYMVSRKPLVKESNSE